MRSRQLFVFLCLLAFAALSVLYIRAPSSPIEPVKPPAPIQKPSKHEPLVQPSGGQDGEQSQPHAYSGSAHPISELIQIAEQEHQKKLQAQSKTLEEAVKEYKRRHGIAPPPNFDKWYDFAQKKGVQMIDEYDSIQETLMPFWSLSPATIRGRAREALGFGDNNLIGALIRNGQVKKIDGAWNQWQKDATVGMMAGFIKYLPDMDLPFNVHDEPRVIIPSSDLDRMIDKAHIAKAKSASAKGPPRNTWSPTPKDMSDGSRLGDVKYSRFNVFAHQSTWTHSRMSCPPESPARALEDGPKEDNTASYSYSEFGFIKNKTAFSDICQSPSLRETYGFFERPNAYNIVHDLFPVFSQSKLSSYADILYPSPWYWDGKVTYNSWKEYDWEKKLPQLYWRGSTTGGFSRGGGWRRQHRQKIVADVNSHGHTNVLTNSSDGHGMQVESVPRSKYASLFDVYFSGVGQCDEEDCNAQKEFFDIRPGVGQQDAWQYKYLLDMDGNAFSGRFYAFLLSKSLVFKMAFFREWHEEWLKPWLHYVPLSLKGTEWVEALRWFDREEAGKKEAEHIAMAGREWAGKVLRNEDLEVWFFRLLLEYGRLVDDDRDVIGYS